MIVRIMSQHAFEGMLSNNGITDDNVQSQGDAIFISIVGSGRTDVSPFKANHDNVLVLKFDDLSEEEGAMFHNQLLKVFDDEQAQSINDFLLKNKDKKYCFVHCSAGISRSGAVGTFANDMYGDETFFIFRGNNREIKPNADVLAKLRRIYNESNSGC